MPPMVRVAIASFARAEHGGESQQSGGTRITRPKVKAEAARDPNEDILVPTIPRGTEQKDPKEARKAPRVDQAVIRKARDSSGHRERRQEKYEYRIPQKDRHRNHHPTVVLPNVKERTLIGKDVSLASTAMAVA